MHFEKDWHGNWCGQCYNSFMFLTAPTDSDEIPVAKLLIVTCVLGVPSTELCNLTAEKFSEKWESTKNHDVLLKALLKIMNQ